MASRGPRGTSGCVAHGVAVQSGADPTMAGGAQCTYISWRWIDLAKY